MWVILTRNTPYSSYISEQQQPMTLSNPPPVMSLALLLYNTKCSDYTVNDINFIPANMCSYNTPVPLCLVMWRAGVTDTAMTFTVTSKNPNITLPEDLLLFADGYYMSNMDTLMCDNMNVQQFSGLGKADALRRFVFNTTQIACGASCTAGSFQPTPGYDQYVNCSR